MANRQPAGDERPSVAVILPAYNEAAIVEKSLAVVCAYMESIEKDYRWEVILVNDGSRDNTGALAEAFAKTHKNVTVLHHPVNFGMGQALSTGFRHSTADYAVTLDLDLSFSPDHIPAMLERMRKTHAKIVIASPYHEGGKLTNVPWHREVMSITANWFLKRFARGNLSSLTGVMRAYDGRFLRSLDLRCPGMDVNPEIIYKGMVLRARIEEVPAHLDWSFQALGGVSERKSSMRIARHIIAILLSGFMFRPFVFFVLPGLLLLVFAAYVNTWMVIHWWGHFQRLSDPWFLDRASHAVGAAYREFPHTFIVGGIAATLSIQLLSLGLLALQSKRYFEEIFHLGTSVLQAAQANGQKEK
jgi:glycosyltransferase involved in cell wall biosynthesis